MEEPSLGNLGKELDRIRANPEDAGKGLDRARPSTSLENSRSRLDSLKESLLVLKNQKKYMENY